MKKTTVKPIALHYRPVGSAANVAYRDLMGVLKGLSIGQDEPEATEIEAEFYDSPFDIFYDGNPVTMTFELANYDLSELPDLFGGEYSGTDDAEEYEGAANAYTSEWEWKLDFQRGHRSLVIYKGLTIGTIKKDADGALNYSTTITALVYNDGVKDRMYKIVGGAGGGFTAVDSTAAGYDASNPYALGWYSKIGTAYVKTDDTEVEDGKTYYRKN